MSEFKPYPVGVWIDAEEVRARPGAPQFHGRIAMVVTKAGVLRRRDATDSIQGDHPIGIYCRIELDGQRALISTDHLFNAPAGAKVGDAFHPDLDVTGDTAGVACGDGYEVSFSGMCPVQGDTAVGQIRAGRWSRCPFPVPAGKAGDG